MHERLTTTSTGAEPTSAPRERATKVIVGTAASIAVALALAGASTISTASAAHARGASLSVAVEVGDPVPFYVVQSSVNGQQEFLFEIAQRFLGDGNRFNEIFDLNEGRPQPDGGAMTTPTSLLPGWVLQLPEDAKGDGLQFGPLPGAPGPEAQPQPDPEPQPTIAPEPSPSVTPSDPPESPAPQAAAPVVAPETTAADAEGMPVLAWIILLIVVVIAVAGGIFVWLRRRRAAAVSPQSAPPIADRSASWTIDSALKILVSACDEEQIRFPGLYLVTVEDASIHVLLSTPSPKVPTGWTASSDGRTWSASLAYLQGQRVPEVSDGQFSRLATLGTTETARLLLNFEHANGPVSVEGSPSAVTDVVEGWLSEFVSNPWSDSPHIVRLGGHDSAGQETLEQFLARIDGADGGIAVLHTPPNRSQGEALRALYSRPDFGWTVIVKGAYAGASWRFTARDGLLTSGLVPDLRYSVSPRNPQHTSEALRSAAPVISDRR